MNNNRKYFAIVALLLFSTVGFFVQAGDQDLPLLTQQINQGEVLIAAGSSTALVPGVVAIAPAVSSVTGSDDCKWYQVQCYKGSGPTLKCECHNLFCDSGWTQGPCPQ